MYKASFWFWLVLFASAVFGSYATRQTVHIGGIFPMSGAWAGGQGCRPAVDMALESVNNRSDLFPTFDLQMISNDSQVQ